MRGEKHQVWDAVCMNCQEGITHPICPECIEKEIIDWARAEAPVLVQYITDMMTIIPSTGDEQTYCIFCGQKFNLCTFCITRDIVLFLESENPRLLKSFVEQFGIYTEVMQFEGVWAM